MKKISLVFFTIIFLACGSTEFRSRETGALVGGALGAGLGAIVGHQTGNAGAGVAIGAGIGAVSGGLVGNSIDNRYDDLESADQRIEDQDRRIAENHKLIEELKRRGVDVYASKRGVVVNLPDVLFEFDRARLTSAALGKVQDISEVVRQYPQRQILVEGHTDSVGTIVYNKRLSEDRARNVADELVAQGISRRRVTSAGFGESRPIASNRSDQGRQRNRRVEVIIQ